MAVTHEEPILSRLDRLDNLIRHMEEMNAGEGRNRNRNRSRSPKSSSPSTPSSSAGTEGQASSLLDFSPRDKHPSCRSIHDVIAETEYKGTLLDRVDRMEDRLFKVCEQLEKEMEASENQEIPNSKKKKGLKQFVKSCVKSKGKEKEKDRD